ncbi:MAG: putative endonuclease [Rhodobacteraceae bacterium HLUCCA12]|nr:MAG: putative endonuclease [Rhodobacteraceae bacterium HLUCCA12]
MTGLVGYLSGQVAESQVADHYAQNGMTIAARRWRGKGGEIDLILRDGDALVFVEVKRSRHHARAAERLSARQIARLFDAAGEYMAATCDTALVDARFDVALVDGAGRVAIIENALHA